MVEAENAPAALTTESYARVSIAFPKILCRHCHIWPMHAKEGNPCRPVGSLFFHDACQYIFHKPAVDWSTSPRLRFPQVRFWCSWIFHRSFCNSNHPKGTATEHGQATDRQPLPQAFHRNFMFTESCLLQPPVILTQPDQLHSLQRIQTTTFTEILGLKMNKLASKHQSWK